MAVETRTVHFTIDPALRAYMAWCDAEGCEFDLQAFDLFAAGYRARVDEEPVATPAEQETEAR